MSAVELHPRYKGRDACAPATRKDFVDLSDQRYLAFDILREPYIFRQMKPLEQRFVTSAYRDLNHNWYLSSDQDKWLFSIAKRFASFKVNIPRDVPYKYYLAYDLINGLKRQYSSGPFESFDPEWVKGQEMIFIDNGRGRPDMAGHEVLPHVRDLSPELHARYELIRGLAARPIPALSDDLIGIYVDNANVILQAYERAMEQHDALRQVIGELILFPGEDKFEKLTAQEYERDQIRITPYGRGHWGIVHPHPTRVVSPVVIFRGEKARAATLLVPIARSLAEHDGKLAWKHACAAAQNIEVIAEEILPGEKPVVDHESRVDENEIAQMESNENHSMPL